MPFNRTGIVHIVTAPGSRECRLAATRVVSQTFSGSPNSLLVEHLDRLRRKLFVAVISVASIGIALETPNDCFIRFVEDRTEKPLRQDGRRSNCALDFVRRSA